MWTAAIQSERERERQSHCEEDCIIWNFYPFKESDCEEDHFIWDFYVFRERNSDCEDDLFGNFIPAEIDRGCEEEETGVTLFKATSAMSLKNSEEEVHCQQEHLYEICIKHNIHPCTQRTDSHQSNFSRNKFG